MMRVYRGSSTAPELNEWVSMFIDGIKLFVVSLIYMIPVLIIEVVVLGSAFLTGMMAQNYAQADPGAILGLIGAVLFGFIILAIVSIIIGLFLATAVVRFARTGSFGEAFNFSAIAAHIGKIGFVPYIISLIFLIIIIGIVEIICMMIPYVGMLILLILLPVITLFEARYLTLVYESAGTTA
ncbi:DUF4013 domain-containing protein [Methanoregula sp.]|uniref:DUF4013 domain-containing protein n=1 Tax=Methanoregula sp. TaxID=2052170 RepID=UPI00356ADB4A